MINYRIYLLDRSGKIFHGEDVQAADDASAIAAAQTLLATHNASHPDTADGVEIWRERDLVFTTRTQS